MPLNRRQFLKNASIGTAGIVGGASLLKNNSAFAAYPAAATSQVTFIGATPGTSAGPGPTQTYTYTSTNNSSYTGRRGLIYDAMMPYQSQIAAAIGTGANAKTIVIKPNLVYAASSGTPAGLPFTHVDAVRAVIDFIRAMPGFSAVPIVIAEASAGTTSSLMGTVFSDASQSTCNTYYTLLTTYSNLTLVDLNTNSTVSSAGKTTTGANFAAVTSYLWTKTLKTSVKINVGPIWMSKNYFIISLCRPKTHNCMVATLTTKNCSMGMPITGSANGITTNSKTQMHVVDTSVAGTTVGEDEDLAWNIFQNATQYTLNGHPDFAVMDAWEGMQGNGPIGGSAVEQGCVVAGFDHLAVDRIAAKLMGFSDTAILAQPNPAVTHSYTDLRALVWMSNAGIGNYDITKIQINSGTVGDMSAVTPYIYAYSMPPNYTASPYYETTWLGNDTVPDTSAPSSTFAFPPSKAVGVLRGARPYMSPQANIHAGGVVRSSDVKIDLFLPAGYHLNLAIFDLKGRQIRRLANEYLNNGRYSITWDCKSDAGSRVANGSYIIKLNANEYQLSDKITLMR
jgi:uncharacterized protein (DUF362 family)